MKDASEIFFKGVENALTFLTINQAAKAIGLPHTCLRSMLAEGRLPGFFSGTRYYVNLDMLREKLEQDSRAAMSGGNAS